MNVVKIARILVPLFTLFLPLLVNADELTTDFAAANTAYSAREYDKAIAIYEKILKQEGSRVGVLYNLANSYAQKGEVGLAILNYERALKISPADSDILGNLAKVREDKGLFTEEPRRLESFFSLLSFDNWCRLFLACLLTLALLLFFRFRYRDSQKALTLVAVCCTAFLLVVAVCATVYRYRSYNPLVVIAASVKLQISPFAGAATIGAVEEGRLLFEVKQYGKYIYAVDGAGRRGWLQKQSVAAVCKM